MKHETIGAVMIVRNEEECLEKCLQSLSGIDEIVILDTGSTDNTRDIARRYTDKYYEGIYAWNDNFAEARNKAKEYSTTDWILGIDADEYLQPNGIQKLRDAIKLYPKAKALNLTVESSVGGNYHRLPKLRRNISEIYCIGAVHECLSVRGEHLVDVKVYYGYSPAHKKDPDRVMRILKKELEKNPGAVREKFYLAREYLYRKQWDAAIEWYEKYLEQSTWDAERADAYYRMAICYKQLGKWDLARKICFQAIGINPDFKSALKLMGDLSWPNNKRKWHRIADTSQNEGVLFT